MEKGMYSEEGTAKFADLNGVLWDCVYDQDNTQIYAVRYDESDVPQADLISENESDS